MSWKAQNLISYPLWKYKQFWARTNFLRLFVLRVILGVVIHTHSHIDKQSQRYRLRQKNNHSWLCFTFQGFLNKMTKNRSSQYFPIEGWTTIGIRCTRLWNYVELFWNSLDNATTNESGSGSRCTQWGSPLVPHYIL